MVPGNRPGSPFLHRRALVLRLSQQSVKIEKVADIASKSSGDEYWSFELPPKKGTDCWDLYISRDETKVRAIKPTQSSNEDFFIGRLSLQKLGTWDQILRRRGKLDKVYIAKPQRFQ
ncbi:hypothetical protein QBC33DRAFT_210795 [Phialemonium atrogriseum]|uniref:Uncharacterized protein n=1 Tax=Phialemonium atrogriseum TaxID=1093897 RepID=A0AAJ0BT07_9PEZI|nr:uncharacterized protein QBC33DRAFT_210795 [Phialemonium atrogriseum]KAK1763958.1 hypothetical protein QBC33DRAFT_210795 [Phialemonium atrogriseum]